MYENPFELCNCPVLHCDCGGGVQSYREHYARVLEAIQPRRVFEWGPGENTRMALAAGADVFAIEPILKWIDPLPIAHRKLAVLVVSNRSRAYYDLHGRADSDLFFIDSRRRAACLDLVRRRARPEALVCLHDAQRLRYNRALRRFTHVMYLTRSFAIASMSPLPVQLLGPKWITRRPVELSTRDRSTSDPESGSAEDSPQVVDTPPRVLFASYHC